MAGICGPQRGCPEQAGVSGVPDARTEQVPHATTATRRSEMAATITAAPASAGVGDPAADVFAAWSVQPRRARHVPHGPGHDDGTWTRARGTRSTKPP